jgi:hypothetical protein
VNVDTKARGTKSFCIYCDSEASEDDIKVTKQIPPNSARAIAIMKYTNSSLFSISYSVQASSASAANKNNSNNDKINDPNMNLTNVNIRSERIEENSPVKNKNKIDNNNYFQIINQNLTIDQQSEIISKNVIINRSFNHPFLPISYILTRSSNVIALPFRLQFSTKFKIYNPTISLNQINNIHAPYLIYINLINYKYLYPKTNIKPIVNNNPNSVIKQSVDKFLTQLVKYKVVDPHIFDVYHTINSKTYRNGKNYKGAIKFNKLNNKIVIDFLINNNTNDEYLKQISNDLNINVNYYNNNNNKNVSENMGNSQAELDDDSSGDEDFLLEDNLKNDQ